MGPYIAQPIATVAPLAPAELHELAAKYRRLSELRAERDAGHTTATLAGLRQLATLYPGCLRELDTLGADELRRRIDSAEAAARGQSAETWMAWILVYHRVLRAALWLKGPDGRFTPLDEQLARARRIANETLLPAFVRDAARPPQGRLGVVVLAVLAERFRTPPRTIAQTLFPLRRPSPYTLG